MRGDKPFGVKEKKSFVIDRKAARETFSENISINNYNRDARCLTILSAIDKIFHYLNNYGLQEKLIKTLSYLAFNMYYINIVQTF